MSKILIAEDDKFLANAYRVKLAKSGYEIKIAADGDEVFEILKDFQPQLIMLDLIMPKKDGFVVLEELKKDPKYKSIPVVVASNLGQQEDVERAQKLGAKEYIVKSDISLQDIIEKVENLVK